MITSIDFSRIDTALSTPVGWLELAVVAVCMAVGWLAGHRLRLTTAPETEVLRVGVGGVNRLIFPLVTLLLLLGARAAFRHYQPPFFLSLAVPLFVALALIRLAVYALRGVFGSAAWLATWERAIAFTVWVVLIFHFIGALPEIGAELDAVEIPLGTAHVSLLAIGRAALVVLLTLAATLWLSGLFEQRLMAAAALDSSLRVVMAKSIRALLLLVALLVALQAVGIDLTVLSVFGGALGVGIGLGLQKLASNYIAGFTILLDRSVRLGDMITVDGRFGVVAKVTSRYVVVRGLDGVEAVVPNETLVTTTVLNHSYSTRDIRVAIPVQVSYDSDVDTALRLMEEAAQAEPRVLRAPGPPTAFLAGFGDNGINLELGFWINDPEQGQLNLKSSINRRLWQAFQANGIRIPFPQREMRILGSTDAAPGPGAGAAPTNPPA
ncbi:MAG: mechanosensitive ion channel domain-containing protein [Betaproteobacteria bacterium]